MKTEAPRYIVPLKMRDRIVEAHSLWQANPRNEGKRMPIWVNGKSVMLVAVHEDMIEAENLYGNEACLYPFSGMTEVKFAKNKDKDKE